MSIENLDHAQAIDKIKDLVKSAVTVMFTSALTELPLNSRPMATLDTDDEGNLWFFSEEGSTTRMPIFKKITGYRYFMPTKAVQNT